MSDEDETILLCALVEGDLLIPDNKVARCMECRRRVQYRPHAPPSRKLCMVCAADALLEVDQNIVEITVPERMIEDAVAYLKKKKH